MGRAHPPPLHPLRPKLHADSALLRNGLWLPHLPRRVPHPAAPADREHDAAEHHHPVHEHGQQQHRDEPRQPQHGCDGNGDGNGDDAPANATGDAPHDRSLCGPGNHLPQVLYQTGFQNKQVRQPVLRHRVRGIPLRHLQPVDVQRGTTLPLLGLRLLPRRRRRQLPALPRLRHVHRQDALRRPQLQVRQVQVQLPRVPGIPL
mmetsp:Transcript_13030/g.27403  ORF Transcript_13030/g.27403 Transcript_13030/m.27403 type:complete len:203 (-) Transcript_13030:1155-1763(-)